MKEWTEINKIYRPAQDPEFYKSLAELYKQNSEYDLRLVKWLNGDYDAAKDLTDKDWEQFSIWREAQADRMAEKASFELSEWNRPGVQIKNSEGKTFIIGDLNLNGGTCNDCMLFQNELITHARDLLDE